MCEFISWLEYKGNILFLTTKELESRRGKELAKYDSNKDNWCGHGAICWYYGVKRRNTIQKECMDFSSPDNFPKEIVQAIKNGLFASPVFECPTVLLNKKAREEYNKIIQPAWKEYDKIKQAAWEEYNKIIQAAWEEYNKIIQPAWKEYDKIIQPVWKEYDKIKQAAWEEYNKIISFHFWSLFRDINNRSEAWK